MSELSVYFARAIDARSIEDITIDDKKYANLLGSIDGIISNPFELKLLNPIQDGLNVAQHDLALLRESDIVLADLSIPNYQYIGCIFEMVHAATNYIPVILIVGENDFSNRIFIQAYCNFITKSDYEAIEYIRRLHTKKGIEQQMIEMHAYYNGIAHNYKDNSIRTHKRNKADMKPFMRERAELRMIIKKYARGNVCQIGVGTGDWTRTICETADKVVGVEQSQEMLAQSGINLSSYDNIRLLHCDALKEDISGGPFNCVIIYFLLSLLPPSIQNHLFDRIRKILRYNGLLVVADTKKLGDLHAMGLGRHQLQYREINNKSFILYKEHFIGDSLVQLLEKKDYKIIDSNRKSTWFSWAVSRSLG